MTDYVILREASQVTAEVLADAEEVYSGWFTGDERINWDEFIDRLAKYGEQSNPQYDFDSYDNAAVRKIQRHIRQLRDSE